MDLSIATRGRPIINLTISLGCPGVYIHDYWLLRWPIAWLHGISRRCTLGPRGCTHDQLNWLKYIRLNHIDQLRYIHVQQWVLLLWVPSFQWHKNNHKFQKIQIICEDLCRTIILYFLFFPFTSHSMLRPRRRRRAMSDRLLSRSSLLCSLLPKP